jgi:phosphatidate cytidylyltransferase
MLKQRIITALILIPLVLAILFYASPALFGGVTAALCLLAGWEWAGLVGWSSAFARLMYLLLMGMVFMMMLFMPPPFIMSLAMLWWVLALVLVLLYPRGEAALKAAPALRAVMGLFVILPCWAALNQLRAEDGGVLAVLFILVLIWGADISAYFAGRRFGRRKLLPMVSPGKTMEGAIAAMLFATVLGVLTLSFDRAPLIVWPWAMLLCWVTTAASILGDLFESLMKRVAGVKDSGQWLPGHGGILDRIDSLMAAAPVFVFGAYLLSQYL